MGKTSELHRIQQSFRAVLDAMARPGTVMQLRCTKTNRFEEAGINSSLATLIDMFVDQAVSFSVFGAEADSLSRVISAETHAQKHSVDSAGFIIGRTDDAEALKNAFEKAKGGTLYSPETGATFLIECDHLSVEGDSAYWVSVEGPGVKDSHVFGVSNHDWVWARKRRNDEYPCGVEIILVDREGRVVAIPRSSFVSLLAMEGDRETWVM